MKCHEAQTLLIPYLNKEITRSERELLQAHLTECESCWHEFNALSATQQQVRTGIADFASLAQPSAAAWPKLQRALHIQRTATRPVPHGATPGLSTLIAAVGTALFVFGGLMTPAALNQPIATLSPTALMQPDTILAASAFSTIESESTRPQSIILEAPSPLSEQSNPDIDPHNAGPENIDAPNALEENKSTLNQHVSNSDPRIDTSLTKASPKSNPAFDAAIEDEGIERFRNVPLQRNALRKARSQPSVTLCSWCTRME